MSLTEYKTIPIELIRGVVEKVRNKIEETNKTRIIVSDGQKAIRKEAEK